MNNKDIWVMLENVKFNIKLGKDAKNPDKKYYQNLIDGKKTNNINKLYKFITALEKSGIVPHNSELIELINEAYKTDSLRLFQFISDKNDLLEYWEFLSLCDLEMLCSFTRMKTENTLFYYECARHILKIQNYNQQCDEGLVSALNKIATNSLTLWKRWIQKFENNITWSHQIFKVLENINDDAIIIYAKTITLDLPENSELNDIFNIQILNSTNKHRIEHILMIISDIICKRWEELINYKKEQEDFYNDLFVSPYLVIIIYSLYYKYNSNCLWKRELEKWINIFKNDMQLWFSSYRHMSKYFFLDLSYIYSMLALKHNSVIMDNQIILSLTRLRCYIKRYEYLKNDASVMFNKFMNFLDNLINTVKK